MEVIEAVVEEGGVLHVENVPYEVGTRLRVTVEREKPDMTQEEWVAHIRKHYGALAHTNFEVPEDSPPSEIEPLR